MLVPLSRRRTIWAAYCDACLVGSPGVPFDVPHLARAWAIARLRALGWSHEAPPELTGMDRRHADSAWTGATYCMECASNERMRKGA